MMPARSVFPGILNCFLLVTIHLLTAVGLAVGEVQTDLSVHVIAADRVRTMRNTIQRTGIGMPVDGNQTGLPAPKVLISYFLCRGNAFYQASASEKGGRR